MKETQIIITAKNITAPIVDRLLLWYGSSQSRVNVNDDEFIGDVWQEVGDNRRAAMQKYPLERAAAKAGHTLPHQTT